jgi:transposase
MGLRLYARVRAALQEIVARSKDVPQLRRAQALLALAAGATVASVARQMRVARNTVYNWAGRFLQRPGPIADRLTNGERSGRPDTLFQDLLEQVPALLERKPPDLHPLRTDRQQHRRHAENGVHPAVPTMRRRVGVLR